MSQVENNTVTAENLAGAKTYDIDVSVIYRDQLYLFTSTGLLDLGQRKTLMRFNAGDNHYMMAKAIATDNESGLQGFATLYVVPKDDFFVEVEVWETQNLPERPHVTIWYSANERPTRRAGSSASGTE